MQSRDLGHCLVVCVDMWASFASWPKDPKARWVSEDVKQHNSKVTELFQAAVGSAEDVRYSASLGDGRMYAFPETLRSQAAEFLESLLYTFPLSGSRDESINTSVGVAVGPVESAADNDLIGRPVDVAARLAIVAGPGQVLAEVTARDMLQGYRERTHVDDQAVMVRLPGGGSCWKWLPVPVHEVRRAGAQRGEIRNPQAQLEQALHLRARLAAVSKVVHDVTNTDFQDAYDRLNNGYRHTVDQLRRLVDMLEALTNPRADVPALLNYFWGRLPTGLNSSDPGLEEMARVDAIAGTMRRLEELVGDLREEQSRHGVVGHPNRKSRLLSGDQDDIDATVERLTLPIDHIKSELNNGVNMVDDLLARAASRAPSGPPPPVRWIGKSA